MDGFDGSRLPLWIDGVRVAAYVAAVVAVWWVAGWLRRTAWVRPGDARKVNHGFALGAGALWFGWLPEDAARGSWLTAGLLLFVLLVAVCGLRRRAPLATLFQGHSRECDAPFAGMQVWASWLLAVYGLALTDLLFGMSVTRTAALLLGVGDGVGEPVGARFGRHSYPVPALWPGVRHRRTVEGSAAVLAGSLAVGLLCFGEGDGATWGRRLVAAAGVALGVTFVEALSPRGTDNFTVPVVGGAAVWLAVAWGGF